jgi:hypothetical protein
MTGEKKEEGQPPASRRPGEVGPSHLPLEVQKAKVIGAKQIEEEIVEPIQQHREGRRQARKPPPK